MTTAFSWQNSINLCPASFCTPRPNLPVTLGVSWLPTFAFQSPIMKMTSFLGVSSKGLVCLHRTIQLQLLQHYWSGYRLGLPWYWIVWLGNEQRSFCRFWDCIQVLNLDSFVDHDGYSISSKGFLPTVVGIMVIWVYKNIWPLFLWCLESNAERHILKIVIKWLKRHYRVLRTNPIL